MQPRAIEAQLLSELALLENLPPSVSQGHRRRPIQRRIEALLQAVDPYRFVAGFSFNIPPGKNYPLRTPAAELQRMPGSLCGRPLAPADPRVWCASGTDESISDRYRLIGVGGVFTAEDAYPAVDSKTEPRSYSFTRPSSIVGREWSEPSIAALPNCSNATAFRCAWPKPSARPTNRRDVAKWQVRVLCSYLLRHPGHPTRRSETFLPMFSRASKISNQNRVRVWQVLRWS